MRLKLKHRQLCVTTILGKISVFGFCTNTCVSVAQSEKAGPLSGNEVLDELIAQSALSKPHWLLQTTIDSLLRITIAVEDPSPASRYEKCREFDVESFRNGDSSYIQELFPKCDQILKDRLLEATLSRRRFLKYAELHHEMLSHRPPQNVKERSGIPKVDDDHLEARSQCVASEIVDPNVGDSDSWESRSEISSTSPLMTNINESVPPLPKYATFGEPFQCPCCYRKIQIENQPDWM